MTTRGRDRGASAGPREATRRELERLLAASSAELAAANQEIEALGHAVAHDLRQPLRAVQGFARIVLEDYGPTLDDEGRRLLNVIVASGERMNSMVDDLVALRRTGRAELERVPLDMTEMVDAVVRDLRAHHPDRDVAVEVEALAPGTGDRSLVQQMLTQLLRNAFTFTRNQPGARIEVSCEAIDGEIVYRIRDNGVGFETRHAGRVFEVFHRLHDAAAYPGNGIGLAIVNRIVARHGGRVWAESAPGAGAVFSFTLAEPGVPASGGSSPAPDA